MKKRLNSNHLKLIAIIAMTIDHIADLIYPGFPTDPIAITLHIIGRLTAPIMWFFICEGFHYTKNLKKYLLRMFVFAIISHFAYCFAFGINFIPFADGIFNQTSVIWPLFWAIVVLWILNSDNKLKEWQKWLLIILINAIAFPADWSCIAVMAIATMYHNRNNLNKQMLGMMFWVIIYAVVSFFCVNKVYAIVQLGVILVYPLLKLYNGEKGKAKWMKWFFYIYYPAHLVIIGIIRIILYGNVPILF
ncbi:MAG: TraX family protein [Candidatus Coproplasma sp.]